MTWKLWEAMQFNITVLGSIRFSKSQWLYQCSLNNLKELRKKDLEYDFAPTRLKVDAFKALFTMYFRV